MPENQRQSVNSRLWSFEGFVDNKIEMIFFHPGANKNKGQHFYLRTALNDCELFWFWWQRLNKNSLLPRWLTLPAVD